MTSYSILFNKAIWQLLFNILMTIPFGYFLTALFDKSEEEVIIYSLIFTLIIEILQLTGLCFLYNGSYRLCDIDDIMANTLGGYFGYHLYQYVNHTLQTPLPEIKVHLIVPFMSNYPFHHKTH